MGFNIKNWRIYLISFFWLIKTYLFFKFFLFIKYKIRRIRIWKFIEWHGKAAYFTGFLNKKKVFIKANWSKLEILKNEKIAFDILSPFEIEFMPKVFFFSSFFGFDFIISEFINGISVQEYFKLHGEIHKNLLEYISRELVKIIKILHQNFIVHRDLRPDNVMLVVNGDSKNIKIIDFAFCVDSQNWEKSRRFKEIDSYKNKVILWEKLGQSYKPEKFLWDDAYAVFKIIDEIGQGNFEDKIKKELKEMIKKEIYCINF